MSHRVYVGIDNGIEGALAMIGADGKLISVEDMPVRPRKACVNPLLESKGQAKESDKEEIDPDALVRWLSACCTGYGSDEILVVMEIPLLIAGKGKATNIQAVARFAQAFGVVIGILHTLHVEYLDVNPKTWQARMIPGRRGEQTKSGALEAAKRLFPTAELVGPRGGAKDGRADALLLAEYGREADKHRALVKTFSTFNVEGTKTGRTRTLQPNGTFK